MWYGHITRSSGLTEKILQRIVLGKKKRKRGRQRKIWEYNITVWTYKALSDT